MKISNICIIILFLIFIFSHNILANYAIDRVYYNVKVDLQKIESLELKIENDLDTINTTGLKISHNGDKFNLLADWRINFLKRSTYNVNLNFLLPIELDGHKFGKGIGLSGEGFYASSNKFYWGLDYFANKDEWRYEVGIIYPFVNDSYFRIGVGNTYWNSDNTLNLGFLVDIN